MNERTNVLPHWWCLNADDNGEDINEIASSLNIFAGRLDALGHLLAEAGELEQSAVNEVGLMLREHADNLDTFSGVIERRAIARKRAAEPKPDALEVLRRQHTDCGGMADRVREIQEIAMTNRHAAVIAEIEAGIRDESDREEADRLLAEALAGTGVTA